MGPRTYAFDASPTPTFRFALQIHLLAIHSMGRLLPIAEDRASYRLQHIIKPRRKLYGTLAALFITFYHGTEQRQWHLDPVFRAANQWNPSGTEALNIDLWAYSRRLGTQSALDDFVTFGEEWFVRPSDRPTHPDNRVECQSFTKGRAFRTVFEAKVPAGPPSMHPLSCLEPTIYRVGCLIHLRRRRAHFEFRPFSAAPSQRSGRQSGVFGPRLPICRFGG